MTNKKVREIDSSDKRFMTDNKDVSHIMKILKTVSY